MSEQRLLIFACVFSVLIHAVVFLVGGELPPSRSAPRDLEKPIEVSLVPPETPPRGFVDVTAPATQPVQNTDLIAVQNAQAQDMSAGDGPENAPDVDQVDDHDTTAVPTQAQEIQQEPESAPPAEEAKEKQSESPASGTEPKQPPEEKSPGSGAMSDEEAAAEPIQMAQAPMPIEPMPEAPPVPLGRTTGRVDGGVKSYGFTGFEARKSEIAPYLAEIRKRVGKRWRSNIQMKYSGSMPTKAVVDCEIGADGKVVRAEIVEAGTSPTFGPLCKDAIEGAGPFPPFPFEVPDIYRNRNLEIRWTFSFMTR